MIKALFFLIVTGFSWVSVGAVIGHVERRGLHLAYYQLIGCLMCIGLGVASWAVAPGTFFPRSGCPASTWVGVLAGTLSCGVFEFLMVRAMGRAMKCGPNAIVWAIIQSGLIYPFLMGSLVFGVPMGLRRLFGIALIVISVFLYARGRRAGAVGAAPPAPLRQWLVPALLGMLCCGINQCGANLPSYLEGGQEFSSASRTLLIYLGLLSASLSHFAVRALLGKPERPLRRGELWTLASYAAVVGTISFMASKYLRFPGLDILERHGAGSLGYPIMVASCIVGFFIYGIAVLRERPSAVQFVGTALALVGIVLISTQARGDTWEVLREEARAAAPAGAEAPLAIRTGVAGAISYDGGDITIVAFGPGWSTLPVREDTAAAEEEAQNLAGGAGVPIEVVGRDGAAAMKGRATWTAQPDGTVLGEVALECVRPVWMLCLALDAGIAAPPPAGLGDSVVAEYDLPAAGGRTLHLAFDAPQPVHAQDSRQWGGSWDVRFGDGRRPRTFAAGDRVAWRVVLSNPSGAPLSFAQGRPVEILPGEQWAPLDYRKDVAPGSALDFSEMGFQDAPAGKHGWLKAVGDHFEFENLPGVEQRFYGVNLCFTAQYLTHEDADMLAERLVRCGYNAIRIHHHDGAWFASDENREKLDYLLARAFEKGLYVTTDLYVSRAVKWRDIGIDRDGDIPVQVFKAYVGVHDGAFDDWAEHARAFLEHVNPYTGRAYKDEPGMPLISLVNEGKLQMGWGVGNLDADPVIRGAWREYCAGVAGAPGDFSPENAAFDAWVGRRICERGGAVVRALGCRALLTNDNNGRWHGEGEGCTASCDYVDSHFYVDHPQFPERMWHLPSRCDNNNPILTGKPPIFHNGWAENASKPYTITEWNFAGPGRYRAMGGILTGALAARQGWDGLWRFAYSHGAERLRDKPLTTPGYFDCVTDPLSAASDRASVCLFLGRPASVPAAEPVSAARTEQGPPLALSLDKARGSMTLVSPRICGGFAESGRIDAGPLSFEIAGRGGTAVPTTLWASSLDGEPLPRSSRILLVHLTDVQGEGTRYADESRRLIMKWGKGCLVEIAAADVALRLGLDGGAAPAVYELDTTGRRVGEVPSRVEDGALRFTVSSAGPNGGRLYYEIAR